jgi:hypothetical protein
MARTLVGEDTLGAFVVASEFLFPVILMRSIWLVGKSQTDMPVIPKKPAASSPIATQGSIANSASKTTTTVAQNIYAVDPRPVRRRDRYLIRGSVIRRSRAVVVGPEESHIDRVHIQRLRLGLKS